MLGERPHFDSNMEYVLVLKLSLYKQGKYFASEAMLSSNLHETREDNNREPQSCLGSHTQPARFPNMTELDNMQSKVADVKGRRTNQLHTMQIPQICSL